MRQLMAGKIVPGSTIHGIQEVAHRLEILIWEVKGNLLLVKLRFVGCLAVMMQLWLLRRQVARRWGCKGHIEVRDCRPL